MPNNFLPHRLALEIRNARGTPIISERNVVPAAKPRLFWARVRWRSSKRAPPREVALRVTKGAMTMKRMGKKTIMKSKTMPE
jgi:hypothetical protein